MNLHDGNCELKDVIMGKLNRAIAVAKFPYRSNERGIDVYRVSPLLENAKPRHRFLSFGQNLRAPE
jgi:hypothetical protein